MALMVDDSDPNVTENTLCTR